MAQEHDTVPELAAQVGGAVAAGDQHRDLHVPVGDGLGQRVVKDDLLGLGLGVRRGRKAEQRLGRQVAYGGGELRAEVGVVLIGDHHQVVDGAQMLVEAGTEVLVVVPDPP